MPVQISQPSSRHKPRTGPFSDAASTPFAYCSDQCIVGQAPKSLGAKIKWQTREFATNALRISSFKKISKSKLRIRFSRGGPLGARRRPVKGGMGGLCRAAFPDRQRQADTERAGIGGAEAVSWTPASAYVRVHLCGRFVGNKKGLPHNPLI